MAGFFSGTAECLAHHFSSLPVFLCPCPAATGMNISRTGKDLLSALFRDEEEKRKKKEKKKSERE